MSKHFQQLNCKYLVRYHSLFVYYIVDREWSICEAILQINYSQVHQSPNIRTVRISVYKVSQGYIIITVIFLVSVCRNDSLPSLCESPVEFKDVNERKSQEQERSVQPPLQPNPSYEPLNVSGNPADLSDAHKKNSASQEHART